MGSEYEVLLNTEYNKIKEIVGEQLADFIIKNRSGNIEVKPGYDGVYGEAIFSPSDVPNVRKFKHPQKTLMDYHNRQCYFMGDYR